MFYQTLVDELTKIAADEDAIESIKRKIEEIRRSTSSVTQKNTKPTPVGQSAPVPQRTVGSLSKRVPKKAVISQPRINTSTPPAPKITPPKPGSPF